MVQISSSPDARGMEQYIVWSRGLLCHDYMQVWTWIGVKVRWLDIYQKWISYWKSVYNVGIVNLAENTEHCSQCYKMFGLAINDIG